MEETEGRGRDPEARDRDPEARGRDPEARGRDPEAEDLQKVLEVCRDAVEDLSFPTVHRWREAHPGGKILGHFQVYFPEELAHAAGMLPITVQGAGSAVETKTADSRLASFICSIVRTSLELGLAGHLEFLDAFVTQPICDAARHLCGIWGRNLPGQLSRILYLPQNANSAHAPRFLASEYRRLLAELETLTGHPVGDEDLRRSLTLYNENRRLVRELYRIKREQPWLVPLRDAYVLVRAGSVMPKEDHNELLRRALESLQARRAKPQDRVRVVLEGAFCEQPPLDMLEVIEDSCYVVDDDLEIGARWIEADVPLEGDPCLNLATAYLERSSYSPVQHDHRKRKEDMLLARVRAAHADAVVLAGAKMCEPGLDEQTGYQKALERENVPFLVLEFEERQTIFEQMRMQVETFAESLLFAAEFE